MLNRSVGNELALQDLLSGRAFSVMFEADAEADHDGAVDLARCLRGNGDDADLGEDRLSYVIEATAARHVRDTVIAELMRSERLAAVYEEDPRPSGFVCRQIVPLIHPEIRRFMDLLRENRRYAKAGDLLDRLPSLDRLSTDIADAASCPT